MFASKIVAGIFLKGKQFSNGNSHIEKIKIVTEV